MKPESTLKITEVAEGVLHVNANTQYEIASTFMRVQEFYESPYGEIREQYFSHERYMDICAYGEKRSAADEIVFSYLEDWNGFNVPGHVFDEWAKLFEEYYLWDKEKQLIELIYEKQSTTAFYVIGTNNEGHPGDYNHELSHAWYYLDPEYKESMKKLVDNLSDKVHERIKEQLLEDGYRDGDNIIEDEMIAYLTTDTMTELDELFKKVRIPWTSILKIQKAFMKFKEEKIDEAD